MADLPFIKFYPSDFLGGTSGLSPAQRGVYITLLCLIFEAGGPIPRRDAHLARRCGAPKATFVRLLGELIEEGKILERDGMLSNRRAEKALVDRQIRSQNATHAANEKWRAHREKTVENQSPSDAGASLRQCVGDAKPEARSQSIGGGGGTRASDVDFSHRERLLEAIGADPVSGLTGPGGRMLGRASDMEHVKRWSALGLSEEDQLQVVREVMASASGPPATFAYFDKAMARLAGERQRPALSPAPPSERSNGSDGRPERLSPLARAVERGVARIQSGWIDEP